MADVTARIGPNAILQFVPVLEGALGVDETAHMLAMAGIIALPDPAKGLIEEGPAARLHQAVRQALPGDAARLSSEAGRRTGDYILAHRIPKPAQAVLKRLPARRPVPILSKAIAKHAWTFCGSGSFGWSPAGRRCSRSPTTRWCAARCPTCRCVTGTRRCSSGSSPRSAGRDGKRWKRNAVRKGRALAGSNCGACPEAAENARFPPRKPRGFRPAPQSSGRSGVWNTRSRPMASVIVTVASGPMMRSPRISCSTKRIGFVPGSISTA